MRKACLILFVVAIFFHARLNAQELVLTVLFDYNKSEIPDSSLVQLARTLHKYPIEKVLLEGHCDSIGSRAYNLGLSKRRADAVKKLLLHNGISDTAIKTCIGFGKDRPLNANTDSLQRQRNRRVHVTFYYSDTVSTHPVIKRDTTNKVASRTNQLQNQSLEVGKTIVLENMLFYPGRHILRPESEPVLCELLQVLRANRSLVIEIQGHVCCTTSEPDGYDWDTDTHNLSLNRARAVYEYLVMMGINAKRLSYTGFGGTRKINQDESSEELKAVNRRVEIKILKTN